MVPSGRGRRAGREQGRASSAEAGLEMVRRMLLGGEVNPLEAIGTAQAIARGAEEVLAVTVGRARDAGYTWAQIGQELRTSRQAAFQRFGRPPDPRTGTPMEPVLTDAGERALRLLGELVSGRWDSARATFSSSVAEKLSASQLAALWAEITGLIGRCEGHETPSVFQAGDYTVVDVPLRFEAGDRISRISYGRDSQVAGIFFLAPRDG